MTAKKATETRGGARTGAGRKPMFDEAMRKYQVALDEKTATRARKYGKGNLSAGVRRAVASVRL